MAHVHGGVGMPVVGRNGCDLLKLALTPFPAAIQIGADQGPASLAAARGQEHHPVPRGHGHVGIVVAHPAAAAVGRLPWRHARGAVARLVGRVDPRVQEAAHAIGAGRHQLARVVGAVPAVGLLPLGSRCHADDILHAAAALVVDHERRKAVVGHRVGEFHRALRLLHVFGGGGMLDLRQLQIALRLERHRSPVVLRRPEELAAALARHEQVGIAMDREGAAVGRSPEEFHPHVEAVAWAVDLRLLEGLACGLDDRALARDQLPGEGDLLRVALAVVAHREGFLGPDLERVVDGLEGVDVGLLVAAAGEATVLDVDHRVLGSGRIPAGDVADHHVGLQPQLHAVALPAAADVEVGIDHVVHRRRVAPHDGEVEVLPVVHGRHPRGVGAAGLEIGEDVDLPGEIPVVELAVDHHLAGWRHGVEGVVVGLLGGRGQAGEGQAGKNDGRGKDSLHETGNWAGHLRISGWASGCSSRADSLRGGVYMK